MGAPFNPNLLSNVLLQLFNHAALLKRPTNSQEIGSSVFGTTAVHWTSQTVFMCCCTKTFKLAKGLFLIPDPFWTLYFTSVSDWVVVSNWRGFEAWALVLSCAKFLPLWYVVFCSLKVLSSICIGRAGNNVLTCIPNIRFNYSNAVAKRWKEMQLGWIGNMWRSRTSAQRI